MVFRIKTYNNIADAGLEVFPRSQYEVGSSVDSPDGILVRSAKLHDEPLADSLKAVARAGAGVNNVPVERLSEQGIPVFNAPGANANAVKELVLAGLLMGFRNIEPAVSFVRNLDGDGETFEKEVEAGKKRFAGRELPGRCLGVVGLGAIGGMVANAARSLGMEVIGYDPGLTVDNAWRLASDIRQARSLDELLAEADVVSLHVPLMEKTKGLIDESRISVMREGAVLLNFARDGLVDREAALSALDKGHLSSYVTDFPHPDFRGRDRVVALPHLGASTDEAQVNSAVMAARSLRDFLDNGNIRNSVNFPDVVMARSKGWRLAVANANVPNMVGQVGTALADAGLNIVDLLNRSQNGLAYTLLDVDGEISDEVVDRLMAIDGVLKVRRISPV